MANILLIDDDEQFRTMLRQLLERANHDVLEAADAETGLTLYRRSPCEIVITDLVLPGKDGLALIQELLLDYPNAKIVAISGGPRGNVAWLPLAKQLGALRVLQKPFTQEQLVETLNHVLRTAVKPEQL